MALTRAQLLAGNRLQGEVLGGQVQAVTAGVGVAISSNGSLSINTADPAFNAFVRTNSASAYNSYIWPTAAGTSGQQLTKGVGDALVWSDSDGIPWTAKGQLVVGTGTNTQTILNVGTDGQILIADSTSASGLSYTSNYVSTSGATGAANIPAGTTGQQPLTPATGALRYNSTTTSLEFYNGTNWETVASSATGAFVAQSVPTAGTASAIVPSGTTAQQQTLPLPLAGYTRFNTDTTLMEVFNGTIWTPIGAPPNAGLGLNLSGVTPNQILKASTPVAATPPVAGTALNQAIDGSIYWDSNLSALFIRYNDGTTTQWVQATPSGNTLQAATLAEAAAGTLFNVYSSPQTAVPKDAAGMTGAALLPGGTNAQRPGAPSGGWLRWNNDASSTIGNRVEVYNPATTSWRPLEYATPQPAATDYTVTNGQVLSGAIVCKNFTVPAGVTATVESGVSVTSTGNVTIAGTLNGEGLGVQGAAQFDAYVYPGANVYVGPGFGLGPGSSATGGKPYAPILSLAGSGGAGGFMSNSNPLGGGGLGGKSGSGGNSGSSVLIRCYGSISVTGTINCNGSAGVIADKTPVNQAIVTGPGGGSGGTIILAADGSCTNSGTLTANGGAGESGHNSGAGGGGGGGGGWIIIQSRFGTATVGTTSVTGGAGGNNAPGVAVGGGGGGANGGGGGAAYSASTPIPLAGSAGVVQTYGSPL
jgi:hypothetical protein